MEKIALMLAGPLLSAVGLYFRYRKKSVSSWMDARRLDIQKQVETLVCSECGAMMKRREYKSGHRKGSAPFVCVNYPECTNRVWGN